MHGLPVASRDDGDRVARVVQVLEVLGGAVVTVGGGAGHDLIGHPAGIFLNENKY